MTTETDEPKIHIIEGPLPDGVHPAQILPVGDRVALLPIFARRNFPVWRTLREASREHIQPWEPAWPEDALTEDFYSALLDRARRSWTDGTDYVFSIYRASDKALLGDVMLQNVMRGAFQKAELGYWIGQPYTRQGYMAEAVKLACGYAFDTLGLHRLEATPSPHNEPSKRLLRRLGFTCEGLAKERMKINSQWQDQEMWGMIRK